MNHSELCNDTKRKKKKKQRIVSSVLEGNRIPSESARVHSVGSGPNS